MTEGAVGCLISDTTYPLPPRPKDCELDWVKAFWVGDGVATIGDCRGDVLVFTRVVLPYGTTSVVGRDACTSRLTGMLCWDTNTKHGFQAARAAYALH